MTDIDFLILAFMGITLALSALPQGTRFLLGVIIMGMTTLTYTPKARATDWGDGLNCDAIANLSRAVMTQKELGTDKQSLKVMAYTAAIGSGTTSLTGLTDALVESAFRLEGMTPNLFAAIMYNECARANYDVASKGKKKEML